MLGFRESRLWSLFSFEFSTQWIAFVVRGCALSYCKEYDGASPHYTREVKNFLNRDGKVRWSPRFSVLDLVLYGVVSKNKFIKTIFQMSHIWSERSWRNSRNWKTITACILFRCRSLVEQTCVCSNEKDIFNNTCNSTICIALESSTKE